MFVVGADGARPPERIPGDGVYPAWSPDGTHISFIRYERNRPTLYVARADGSRQEKIVPASREPSDAAWSPDGSEIVFAGVAPHTFAYAIFTVHPDGTDLLQLTRAHASLHLVARRGEDRLHSAERIQSLDRRCRRLAEGGVGRRKP